MNILKNNAWEIGAIVSLLLAIAVIFLIPVGLAHANPLRFPATAQSAAATTTVTYLTSSTATTTLFTYDTYANGGGTQATDKAVLNVQLAASSTSSVLDVTVEHSQDDIDWYQDELSVPSSAGLQTITVPNSFVWTAAGTATSSKAVLVPTPERYLRVKASISGASGAVWAQLVGQKQSN